MAIQGFILYLVFLLGICAFPTNNAFAEENTASSSDSSAGSNTVSEKQKPKVIRPFGKSSIEKSARENQVGGKFSHYSNSSGYSESTPVAHTPEPTRAKSSRGTSRCKSSSTRARG